LVQGQFFVVERLPLVAATMSKSIFLRGFDFGTTTDDIETHCAAVGEVVSVELKGNKDKERSKGALVTFASEEIARQAAEELNKSTIAGNERYIEVSLRGVATEDAAASQQASGKGNGKGKAADLANAAWEMGMMMGMKGGNSGKGIGKDALKGMFAKMFGKGGGKSKQAKVQPNTKTWKSKLWEAYSKTYKTESMTKDTIVFTTGEAVGGVYTTTVSSDNFASTYEGEGDSLKASVNAAAEVTLRAEFPDLIAEFEQEGGSWGGGSDGGGGAAAMAQWMGGGGGALQQQPQQQPQSLPARSQLQNAYCKKHKSIAKGSVCYSTEKTDAEAGNCNMFVSTVSSETFADSYTGAPAIGKKAAEENAALLAMQAEFPDEYEGSKQQVFGKQGAQAERGEKRKRGGKDRTNEQKRGGRGGPKGQLNSALRKITKEAVDAGMIEYCTTEEQEMTITTVVIKCLDPEQSFTGDPVDGTTPKSKREAEDSAATVAYEALKDHMDVAEAEQETEQEAKRQKAEEEGNLAEGLV